MRSSSATRALLRRVQVPSGVRRSHARGGGNVLSSRLRHGGRDNGAPGLRPDYGPDYYAAFVVDPDGYRIEAVINGAG